MQDSQLALVLGDLHIPQRATTIPSQFASLLVPNKMQYTLCTGNIGCKEKEDYLRTIAPNMYCVRGDTDHNSSYPESRVIQIGNFKIGLMHGHQIVPWGDPESIGMVLRELDVDIMITGHTHELNVSTIDNRCVINPGSLTGAYSPYVNKVVPSFCLLAINGNRCQIYVYSLKAGKLEVQKSAFTKQ